MDLKEVIFQNVFTIFCHLKLKTRKRLKLILLATTIPKRKSVTMSNSLRKPKKKINLSKHFPFISLICLSDSNEIRTHSHLIRKRTLNHLAKLPFKKSFATKKSTRKIRSRKLPAPPKFEFCRFWNKIRRNRSTDRFRLLMGICICKGEM